MVPLLGHTLPGVFLLLTTVIGCNMTAAVVLMCLAVGSEGLVGAGSFANNLDLSGRFAGTYVCHSPEVQTQISVFSLTGVTFGIYNTLGSVCGVVAPYVAGVITQKDVSEPLTEWYDSATGYLIRFFRIQLLDGG